MLNELRGLKSQKRQPFEIYDPANNKWALKINISQKMPRTLLHNILTKLILTGWLIISLPAVGSAVEKYDLDDPREPWRESKSGITTQVMPPYTPLVRKENSVECWGRTYELGALFPVSVTSQGHKIFTGPVTLKIKTGGKWTAISGLYPSFGRQRDDRIEFSSDANLGSLRISADSWIEYDGLIRVDLKLASKEIIQVEGLELIFSFEPNASIFYHTETLWGPHIYKRSPTTEGAVVKYDWQPLIWVGNHDVGFTVVTETRDGWTSVNDAIEFKRNSKSFDLTLHIITKPVELKSERIYTFGLQATPVKKIRPDRWGIIIGTLPGENLRLLLPTPQFEPLFSYPQPNDFNAFDKYVRDLHKEGIRSCSYITTSATSEKSEVNKRHHKEWLISKAIFGGGEWKVEKGLIGAESCCPASSFSDFMAWAVEKDINTFDIDGIYIDNPGPYRCENALHGCGKGGVETYPYFALRDLHKRIYTIVKTKKINGFVWEHTSQRFNSLQMSWVDIYSDGEHFRDSKYYPRKQLPEMIDRNYLDITATGYQMGAVPVFLSSLTVREDRKDGEWSEWLLSRLLPYGQMIWAHQGWMDASTAMAAQKARTDFGLGKEPVRFFRPNELPKWFVINSPKRVIACLWQRVRDNAAMAVIANWNDQAVLISIPKNNLNDQFGQFILQDPMTNIIIPDQYPMIAIPANSFRMIIISKKSFK